MLPVFRLQRSIERLRWLAATQSALQAKSYGGVEPKPCVGNQLRKLGHHSGPWKTPGKPGFEGPKRRKGMHSCGPFLPLQN